MRFRQALGRGIGAVLVLAAGLGCERDDGEETTLRVFAAASLQDAMTEVAEAYRARHPEVRVQLNFAGSNTLARQIASARSADVFVSADERWMSWLAERDLLEPGTRTPLLANTLVIAARSDSPLKLAEPRELAEPRFTGVVLADPDSVPAGRYARSYLESVRVDDHTLWDALEGRRVPTLDVRAALAAVAADPRRVGIVYRSDLLADERVHALYRVSSERGPKIRYPAAVLRARPQLDEARRLLAFLKSDPAQRIFQRWGFTSKVGDD